MMLEVLGHPQQPTEVETDNASVDGFANGTMKLKTSKAMDMRYNWVPDRVRQGHFVIIWRPGKDNLADFFTKPQPVYRHLMFLPLIVRSPYRAKPTATYSIPQD